MAVEELDDFIQRAFHEDIGEGDHTSMACVPPDAQGRAKLLVKDEGILAGVAVAERILHYVDSSIDMEILMPDGVPVRPHDIAFHAYGKSQSLLKAERLLLNTMQRMSGIATMTHQYTDMVKDLPVKILDTRKTTPTLRFLEKMAVKIGGGQNYRYGLYDRIMIKDNHVDFCGDMQRAIREVNEYLENNHLELEITVEVRNLKELHEAMAVGSFQRIMLDNFSPQGIREAVRIIGGKYETEASGGITLETLRAYAETGVDFISIGALTHSFKSLDLSFKRW
jgi:nicotinate-nucleotide pyrophosphorylase (carboxylating)